MKVKYYVSFVTSDDEFCGTFVVRSDVIKCQEDVEEIITELQAKTADEAVVPITWTKVGYVE